MVEETDIVWRKQKEVWNPTIAAPQHNNPASPDAPATVEKVHRKGGARRDWVYTIFGKDGTDTWTLRGNLETLHETAILGITFHVFQYEICPTTKRRHIQGFISFESKKRFGTVQKLLPPGVHLEPRRGSVRAATDYCRKEETRDPAHLDYQFTFGNEPEEEPGQGSRTDIAAIKTLLDNGGTMKEVADFDFAYYIRCYKGLQHYANLKSKPRHHKTKVFCFIGETGTGKSYAVDAFKDSYWVPPGTGNTVWYDGYEPNYHKTIIFDEFSGSWCKWRELLRITDKYPSLVNIKGGHVDLKPLAMVFTSNYDVENWYNIKKVPDPAPFLRRIDYLWRYYGRYSPRVPDEVKQWVDRTDHVFLDALEIHSFAHCVKGDPAYHPCSGGYLSVPTMPRWYAIITKYVPPEELPVLW